MKKKISAVLAAAVVLLSITSCSKTNDGSENEPINNSAGVLYETWKDIDRDKVIAHIEGADSEKFDITFGEFYSEYLYYLISYNIDDDMSAAYKDACETYREDIITYLTFERIFLQVAEEKGCGLSSLTDEEKTQIETNVQATIDNFTSNYTATATEELGEAGFPKRNSQQKYRAACCRRFKSRAYYRCFQKVGNQQLYSGKACR